MTKILIADVETDGLDYTKIHCISAKLWKGKTPVRRFTDMEGFYYYCQDLQPDKWVFHNGLNFDVHVINDLTGVPIDPKDVIDTAVVSKLVNYSKFNTHSLKELGEHLRVYKGDYTGGWEEYTEEMGAYCDQDVEVLEAIFDHYKKYIFDPKWAKSMRVEHDMALICHGMQRTGFTFNTELATDLLDDVTNDMKELEDNFKVEFGSKLVEVKRNKLRYTKEGKLYGNIIKDIAAYPKVEFEGTDVVVYDYKVFKPSSPKDRIDVLWDAGWKPFDKTKGHITSIRKAREEGRKLWRR
jgi:hypothetical protein